MRRVTRHLAECREGFRILCTAEFWRAFGAHWSAEAVAGRVQALVDRQRGQG